MQTVRLTTAQAIVRYLLNQRVVDGGEETPVFAGVFAIFGHGNVTCLGEALEPVQDRLPTWRGQNEQSRALAAIAGGDAWWDVGVPEVSDREEVRVARAQHEAERKHQRIGI